MWELFVLFLQLACKFEIISKYLRHCLPPSSLVSPAAWPRIPHSGPAVSTLAAARIWAQFGFSTRRLADAWAAVLKTVNTCGKTTHRVSITQCTNDLPRRRKLPSKLSIMDLTSEYYLSELLGYILCWKGRQRKRHASQAAWRITELHRGASAELLLFKSGLFSVTDTKHALLTDFLRLDTMRTIEPFYRLSLNLSEVVFRDRLRASWQSHSTNKQPI